MLIVCPTCDTVTAMRVAVDLSENTCLIFCPTCGGAWDPAELQERTYEAGYADALAEMRDGASPRRRPSHKRAN
jgi:Zn-finger nucleic acid-binding protein